MDLQHRYPGLRFRVLGHVEADLGTRRIAIGPPLQRSLLAILLLEANRPIQVDELVCRLWGNWPPPTARESLSSHVARLRSALDGTGARLPRGAGGYQLDTDPDSIDVHRFRGLLIQARAARDDDGLIEQALGLWRGQPFSGTSSPWLQRVRESLNRQRLSASLDHAVARLRRGNADSVAEALGILAEEYPLDERLLSLLMTALARSGRRAEALRVYERTRRHLADEFGIDPSALLRDAFQEVLRDEM